MDLPPITLNPRSSIDATGQRVGALIFRALTRLDANLEPTADIAESWRASADGLSWRFKIRPGLRDHGGEAITPQRMLECLEQYRAGKPASIVRSGFSGWKSTHLDTSTQEIIFEYEQPDPYFPRNVSLLRYFRTEDPVACTEPKGAKNMVGSGPYEPKEWSLSPQDRFELRSLDPRFPNVELLFVRDESTRALILLKGQADIAQNSLSLTKTRWVQKTMQKRFTVLERPGTTVQYLAFNIQDKILSDRRVRLAIAHAIPRQQVVDHKMSGLGSLAQSFVSPLLPESAALGAIPYSPKKAGELLDRAGYRWNPRKKPWRFELRYRVTTSKDGLETALITQSALRKVGVDVILDVVEPANFLHGIKQGKYQLYSARWVGVGDGSILYRTLHSTQSLNRVKFQDPEMDKLLDEAMKELDSTKRRELLMRAQSKMIEEMPYFPLWYWNIAAIVRKDWAGDLRGDRLSLTGAYEPILESLNSVVRRSQP